MANSSITPVSTSSRCITEHVTATLDYEVTNYLELEGMSVGQFISSPVYRVGGYDWKIRFYPAGENSKCPGNASVVLLYLSEAKDVSTKFTFSMLETKSQTEVDSVDKLEETFSPEEGYWQPLDMSKLKSISPLGDGCLTIRCVLTVSIESALLELVGDLDRMLRDRRGTDVRFCVGGRKFRAHRSFLAARSPVFGAQLFGPMAEKDMRGVKVVDVEPSIFEMMLHYIYTVSLPPCEDEGGYTTAVMQHLLVAADRYGLESLKQMCEEELSTRIDVETVMPSYVLANQHQCNRLKAACIEFMSSEEVLATVLETNEFKERFITSCQLLPLEGEALGTKGSCQEKKVNHRKMSKKKRTK